MLCVFYSVSCPTGAAIIDRNNPAGMIYHPFVTPLEACIGKSLRNVFYQIGLSNDSSVRIRPLRRPAITESRKWKRTNQVKTRKDSFLFQDDLRGPNINAHRHTGNKGSIPIRDCIVNRGSQICGNLFLTAQQLFWPMSCEAAAMASHLGFRHYYSRLDIIIFFDFCKNVFYAFRLL